jgi:hypothetical protein
MASITKEIAIGDPIIIKKLIALRGYCLASYAGMLLMTMCTIPNRITKACSSRTIHSVRNISVGRIKIRAAACNVRIQYPTGNRNSAHQDN